MVSLAASAAHAHGTSTGLTITFDDSGVAGLSAPVSGTNALASVYYENCGTEGCEVLLMANQAETSVLLPADYYVAED